MIKLDNVFTVMVRVRKNVDDIDIKEDIPLKFNQEAIKRFLFRFYEPYFLVDEYKLAFKYTNNNTIQGIILIDKEGNTCIVTNPNQVIEEVIHAYECMIALNKVYDIMNFDFDSSDYDDIPEDEFNDNN